LLVTGKHGVIHESCLFEFQPNIVIVFINIFRVFRGSADKVSRDIFVFASECCAMTRHLRERRRGIEDDGREKESNYRVSVLLLIILFAAHGINLLILQFPFWLRLS